MRDLVTTIGAALLILGVTPARALAQPLGRTIVAGSTITDTLRATDAHFLKGAPYRIYRLEADTGRLYVISLRSSAFDAYLRVEAAVGRITEQLDSDDDGGGGNDALVIFRPPRPGEYLLVASVTGTRTLAGPFTLNVQERIDRTVAPRAIAIGDSLSAELGPASAVSTLGGYIYDLYTLHAKAGEVVRIRLKPDSLIWTAGTLTRTGDFTSLTDGSRSDEDGGYFRAATEGDYAIRVRGRAGVFSARYQLVVSERTAQNAAVETRHLEDGREASARLQRGAVGDKAVQVWTYKPRLRDRLTITMQSPSFDTYVYVGYTRDGKFVELAHNDDEARGSTNSRVVIRALSTDELTIRASTALATGEGAYTLKLVAIPDIAHTLRHQPIAIGSQVQDSLRDADATLDDGSRYVEWTFHAATAGERFSITLRSKDFDTFVSVGQLKSGKFAEFSNNDDAPEDAPRDYVSRLDVVAPNAGDFIIRVNTFGPDQLGAYTLKLDRKT